MARKPAKKSVKKPQGFDLDALLKYLGVVTGKDSAAGYAALGSGVNAGLTKTLPVAAQKTARGIDAYTTGGLGGLGYDLATGKKMSKKQLAGSLAIGGSNFLPLGKIAKLGGPSVKTGRRVVDSAKQLRMLQMLLGGE